jgi:uncharacterized DUF497 family protein
MKFEWDPQKADSNQTKHGVSFQEAASVLGDALSITYPDPDHSAKERRGERIRIISARKTTRQERRYYEEGE